MSSSIRQFTALGLLLAIGCMASAADDIAALEEQSMNKAVARVAPAVVRIETVGGLERIGEVLLGDGPTTGLIVDAEGYIVSSAFNFLRKPSSILVTLPTGKRTAAEIVARDHSRMLVLLKVTSDEPLPTAEALPVEQVQVGQWAIAIGRSFDAKRPNMSVGIVSAKDRIWGKAIQCDAKISPSNYGGPLVDIRGRVIGVLVPMSPNAQSEVAGAEWYDSGIGFAVPLTDIHRSLPAMKQGKDVYRGLLGVALKSGSIYSAPAEIAACQVKSPAYEAGLRTGDTIIEVDGRKIHRQAQLKHALGPRNAGDTVHVVVQRDEEKIETDITLVERLIPYEHPFLGILPMRDADGIVVRYLFSESGADDAGIKVGDKLVKVNDTAITTPASLHAALASFEPKQEVQITIDRNGETIVIDVTLSSLPAKIPSNLPPPRKRDASKDEEDEAEAVTTLTEISVPEQPNKCFAIIPSSYQAEVPHGVVVYLQPPGGFDKAKLLAQWQELCEANDLILLAPQPLDPNRWTPLEVEFVKKTLAQLVSNYNVDKSRVVVYGQRAGGALAYLFAFRNRETTRAVIAVDVGLPSRLRTPDTDPVYPLAILTTLSQASRAAKRIEQTIEQWQEMKYPVTVLPTDTARLLNDQELQQVVRWIDALDRI
jgi:serine protease Do